MNIQRPAHPQPRPAWAAPRPPRRGVALPPAGGTCRRRAGQSRVARPGHRGEAAPAVGGGSGSGWGPLGDLRRRMVPDQMNTSLPFEWLLLRLPTVGGV